jgi:hypothetical protein
MPTTTTTTTTSHRYQLVGTTYKRPRDCTDTGYRVEYSRHTGRVRVTYVTSWSGSREKTWFFADQSEQDARDLLTLLRTQDGPKSLGDPDRIDPKIR